MRTGLLGALMGLIGMGFDDVPPVPVEDRPVGFGESRGIVNARRLGLSKHKHRADHAKKRARKAQRLARRITRRAA